MSAVPFRSSASDQSMSIEHSVDGAAGGDLNLTRKAAQQTFTDFASAPVVLDGSWTVLDSIGRSIQSPYFAGLTEHTLSAPALRLSESLLFTAHECR